MCPHLHEDGRRAKGDPIELDPGTKLTPVAGWIILDRSMHRRADGTDRRKRYVMIMC